MPQADTVDIEPTPPVDPSQTQAGLAPSGGSGLHGQEETGTPWRFSAGACEQPRVEGSAATAALASLLPAPLHASDGKGGATAASQPGSVHSVGSASRGRTVTDSPRLFSPRAGLKLVAGVNPRFWCGQLSPPALREGGECSGLSGEPDGGAQAKVRSPSAMWPAT